MSFFRPEIEAMAGYQPGEQPSSTDVIKLNTNENPYPCSPVVLEAIHRTVAESLRRYPDPSAGPFRRKAAEVLGVEPQTVRSTHHKALVKLRAHFREPED